MATQRALSAWELLALLVTLCSLAAVDAHDNMVAPMVPGAGQQVPPADGQNQTSTPPPGVNINETVPLGPQLVLRTHTQYRALHGAAPLTWDGTIAASAAAFVAQCNAVSNLADLQNQRLGENLFLYRGPSVLVALSIAGVNWYSQVEDYDFKNPGYSANTAYFTQMVWLSSRFIGCAANYCPTLTGATNVISSGVLVSCRYSPPGNVEGQYGANVLPVFSRRPSQRP